MVITQKIFDKYKKDGKLANWKSYINGNYIVNINTETGTKERLQPDDDEGFDAAFPESIDCSITSKCDLGCAFCYANCTPEGIDADIMDAKFIDTLHPYTEIALQANMLDHPDLFKFLEKLKDKNVIVNITVNEVHFLKNQFIIQYLVANNLVKGIGVSYHYYCDEFLQKIKLYPNAVIHVINGVISEELLEPLYNHNLKMLILGYKDLGRGLDYKANKNSTINKNQQWMYDNIQMLVEKFALISFDNLALEQLDIKRILTAEQWNAFYMGDDGDYTFFVDLVNKRYGKSSLAKPEDMMPLLDNVDEMFNNIKCLTTC